MQARSGAEPGARRLRLRPFDGSREVVEVVIWPSLAALRRRWRIPGLLGYTLPGRGAVVASVHVPRQRAMATLIHELAHATFRCLLRRRIKSEERFCATLDGLVQQAVRRGLLRPDGRRRRRAR